MRLCVKLLEVINYQRKAADRKAQICPVSGTNALLICALRPADFLTKCCWSSWETSRTVSFSTPKIFSVNLIPTFRWEEGKKNDATVRSINSLRFFDHWFFSRLRVSTWGFARIRRTLLNVFSCVGFLHWRMSHMRLVSHAVHDYVSKTASCQTF